MRLDQHPKHFVRSLSRKDFTIERAGKERVDDSRSGHGCQDLDDCQDGRSSPGDSANDGEGEVDRGIKEAARHPVERPEDYRAHHDESAAVPNAIKREQGDWAYHALTTREKPKLSAMKRILLVSIVSAGDAVMGRVSHVIFRG